MGRTHPVAVPVSRRSAWLTWGVPLSALALIAGVDLLTGKRTYLVSYLLVAPALAAVVASARVVLTVGAMAVPLRFTLASYDGVSDPWHDRRFFDGTGALVVSAVVLAFFAAGRVRRERRLAAVISVATAAQEAILLPPPSTVGHLAVGVRFLAAAAEAKVGGDLYEIVDTAHGVRVMIGDVAGKGLPAVRLAAVTLGAFREAAHDAADLAVLAMRVEASVRRHLPPDGFVTALFAEFTPGAVTMLHRGHVPALLLPAAGPLRELRPPAPAPPLGLGHLATTSARPWRVPLDVGDVLILVTDGVTEARYQGVFYPLTDRATAMVRPATALPGQLRAALSRGTQLPDAPADYVVDLDRAAENLRRDLLAHAHNGFTTDDAVILLLSPRGRP